MTKATIKRVALATAAALTLALVTTLIYGISGGPKPLLIESFTESTADPSGIKLSTVWQSEPFEIEPFAYYRIRFRAQTDTPAMWSIVYFAEDGSELPADNYSSIDPSTSALEHISCFQGKAPATSAMARFHPSKNSPLHVEMIEVQPVRRRQVARWANRLYRTLPPITTQWPAKTGVAIPDFMNGLRRGKTMRIVMLGDSIANDISNSPFDTLLERMFPRSRVEIVASVRNATGCWFYRHADRLEKYVFDYDPDLVIIAGISHQWDHEAIGDVIDQIRDRSRAEIMVMTGAVTTMRRETNRAASHFGIPRAEAPHRIAEFKNRLAEMTAEKQVAWFPMRAAWNEYVADSGHDPDFFMRDGIHANDRGKQVMARLIESYFHNLR